MIAVLDLLWKKTHIFPVFFLLLLSFMSKGDDYVLAETICEILAINGAIVNTALLISAGQLEQIPAF